LLMSVAIVALLIGGVPQEAQAGPFCKIGKRLKERRAKRKQRRASRPRLLGRRRG